MSHITALDSSRDDTHDLSNSTFPHVQHAMREIGDRLRSLRKRRGLTLDELSRRSGVSSGLVSQLERGIGIRRSARCSNWRTA